MDIKLEKKPWYTENIDDIIQDLDEAFKAIQ